MFAVRLQINVLFLEKKLRKSKIICIFSCPATPFNFFQYYSAKVAAALKERMGAMTSKTLQFDFLIAAKLMNLVPDVIFEALDILLVCPTVDEVEKNA